MMRRFGHGHSLALGALLTLLIERNGWLILASALLLFAAGVTIGRLWAGTRRNGGRLLSVVDAKARTELERAKNVRAKRRLALENARSLRRERDELARREYWRGAADAGKP